MKKHMMQALAVVAALLALAGCGATDATDAGTITASSETGAAGAAANVDTTASVEAFDYDESDVVEILLGATIDTTSDSVSVDGTTATITAAGTYELTGTLDDGQIIVDAGDGAVVQVILNGADITNDDGAAIAVMSAETATVILADGSMNTLTDGAVFVLAEGEDEPNAALFSTADLTLGGTGALTVVGNYNDGIASKDGLIIDSGTITVVAVDDGIRGKDKVVINSGEITVTAGGDGIKSDNDEDPERGFIAITDGEIDVTSADDGVQAVTEVLIGGGELTLASGDDAIKGDLFVTINGGSILITESFEGIESEIIIINDGLIDITSNDDGLNVTSADGTTADTTLQAAPGGGPGDADVGEYYVYINGGTTLITITDNLAEQGDGIDANGHVEMTGGLVAVSGPTDTRNSAIDYSGGSFTMTGGLFVGTNIDGRNSEGIGAGSTQASLYLTFGSVVDAGTLVHIQSTDGESLVTFEPANLFDVVVFSSPELTAGDEYEVYLGGAASGETPTGLYETYSPGTLAGTATAG